MVNGKYILAIIPAYNEEGSVGKVVEKIRNHYSRIVPLVVNDGSTDLTSEKAKAYGAIVLDLPYNLGIGGAMQTGYQYANSKGYDIAIQVDGDGQHDPAEIGKLLNALEERKLDVAIGSRFIDDLGYRSSRMRRMGILLLSRVISTLVGQKITDPTSGFRAANRRAIQLFASDYPQDYPEPEVLVLLHQCHLRVGEVPVGMTERPFGESSITAVRSIYYMVKVLLAIFVDYFKKPPFLDKEEERC